MSRVIASIADRFSTAGMNISISWPVSANCGERDFVGRRNARIEASGIGGICATKETRIRRYTFAVRSFPCSSSSLFTDRESTLGPIDFDELRITNLYQACR